MDSTHPDAEELVAVGDLVLVWLRENGLDQHKPAEVYEALLRRSADYLRDGVDVEKTRFTAIELNALVKGKSEGDDDSDVAGRYVRTNVAKFQELLDQNAAKIADYLKHHGKQQRVVIAATDPKGRHKKDYYLTLEPLTDQPEEQDTENPRLAHYRVRQFPKPRPWAKPFLALTLVGWRRWAYLSGLVTIVILGLGMTLLAVFQPLLIWKFAIPIALAVLFSLAVKPLYDILDRSVLVAPDWLAGLSVASAQLELRQVGIDESSGRAIREVRLVVYDGDCPLCGGRLEVVEGNGEFKGRLVGQCANARAEHLYSFDHISKRGVPLRQTGYYGEG